MAPGEHVFRRRIISFAVAAASSLALLPTLAADADARSAGDRAAGVVWSDVDAMYRWARPAINYVGGTNVWMRDLAQNADGTYPFQPATVETRRYFASALVQALAPLEPIDPAITFADLDPSDPFYPFANVAVKLGWMKRVRGGAFGPDVPVTTTMVHRALVFALGLGPAVRSLNAIHTADGVTFQVPKSFGSLLLGMRLGLRYNNEDDESMEVGPKTPLTRAQVAYSLYRAVTRPSYSVPNLLAEYGDVELPALTPDVQAIVRWGVRYVGYPYVWAGEWGAPTPEPAGLGGQPVPGFDCSGFMWWLLRANDGGAWNVSPPRPYAGWTFPQRSSADMARTASLTFDQLQPGDLMFFDGDENGVVDHVSMYIGNGWALDASSGYAGSTILSVAEGWYRDHFVSGRRILPS